MSRSKQSLSNYHLTTLDMGQLVPIGMVPVLPGDIVGHSSNLLIRVSPMAAPVMHQVSARVHHFYVANRNLWPEKDEDPGWEDFITGGEDGYNQATVPTINTTGVAKDLMDHYGLPQVPGIPVNSMPITAFNQIYNEFYRDQDLQEERALDDTSIPRCAWGKDYFTCARPWSQKGPAVSIPIGDTAPVVPGENGGPSFDVDNRINTQFGGNPGGSEVYWVEGAPDQNSVAAWNDPDLYVDLSNATGASPIDVRTAWGLQRFMENAARFGSRYPEKMRQLGSQYQGLMNRPIYLGGGQQSINFSEVLQTAPELAGEHAREFGVGDMYGHGIAATRSNKYAHRCDEHGYIISLLSCRPTSLYQDGIEREWLRQDREDFHDPYLEFVGQQEVYNNEIFADPTNGGEIFGYSDRYEEYRGARSRISGEFRDTLDYWHLGRQFSEPPVLNSEFVTCTPSKRIFNEQSQDSLWVMVHHKIAAHRNIAKSATARLI